jgi:hypothetical protein
MGVPWWGWALIGFGAFWSIALVVFLSSAYILMHNDDCDHHA